MKMGRPVKLRVQGSGEKLFHALKLCGVTWGTRIDSETHIYKIQRWAHLGLPRSFNSIQNDIRDGIPEDRIVKYAKFFNVDPDLFLSREVDATSKEFESCILSSRYNTLYNISFPPLDSDKEFSHAFYIQNNPEANKELFLCLGGVYRFYLREVKNPDIYSGVLYIHSCNPCAMIAKAFIKYHETDTRLNLFIFKMSTFLHINYYAQKMPLMGYCVGASPLLNPIRSSCQSITFNLLGISGGFVSPSVPDLFGVHAIKEIVPAFQDQAQLYAEISNEVEENPFLKSTHRHFETVNSNLLSMVDQFYAK